MTKSLSRPLFEKFEKSWTHIIKGSLAYHFLFLCTVLRAGQLWNCVSPISVKDRVLSLKLSISKILSSYRTKCIQFANQASDSDLEEGVDEKQRHEPEDGVFFTLQRYCILL